eukprot:scaffold268_cov210-Ochromonas_danica.AAC.24
MKLSHSYSPVPCDENNGSSQHICLDNDVESPDRHSSILDRIYYAALRVESLSEKISDELELQGKDLNDMEKTRDDMDNQAFELSSSSRKFSQRAESESCCWLALLLVLVVLIIIALLVKLVFRN